MPKRVPEDSEIELPTEAEADAFDAAIERSTELGYVEHVLCLAREDRRWRENVEVALSKRGRLGKMLHGAKPAAVWGPASPLHKRFAKLLQDDPIAFGDFAMANKRIADFVADETNSPKSVRDQLSPDEAVLATWVLFPLDFKTKREVLEAACDALEARQQSGVTECETEHPPEPQFESDACGHEARIAELEGALREAKSAAQQHTRDLKDTRKELNIRTAEVSRKDRKQQELRDRAKAAEQERDAAKVESRMHRDERDEALRKVRQLESQVKADRQGRETVEEKRTAESGSLLATIRDLREQIQAAQDVSAAMERRVMSLEAELEGERARRAELEQAFEAFGFEDMVKSAMSFSEAVDSLIRIRDAVASYAERQAEQEHERAEAERAADEERKRAVQAKEAQEQAEVAWRTRETDRLLELENRLYPDGELDHAFIDGHNLVHRIFRPEDEARTRPWLENLVVEMSTRLEETKGWTTVYHLVFDTKAESNDRPVGHGVRVYFANNTVEGGADARIAELLRDRLPASHCMVVSTDRKHVWADALRATAEDGRDVDLVQIELLAEYLQLLDEFRKRGKAGGAVCGD